MKKIKYPEDLLALDAVVTFSEHFSSDKPRRKFERDKKKARAYIERLKREHEISEVYMNPSWGSENF
jgi:hypothetical protein